MPLRVLLDHRLDRLADALIAHLAEPPAHPLALDTVIVPSVGVGRWLRHRIAARTGVCAQVQVEFAGRFLWRACGLALPGLPARSPFDPEAARWSVLALLDALPAAPELEPLAQRVRRASAADRFALACEIAAQFDRYLAYRRDWLERWQAGGWADGAQPLGPHEGWQRWLWRALLERLPGVSGRHPFDQMDALLREDPALAAQRLGPQRVALLGAVGLSPEQLAMFGRLAAVLDVSIHAVDPCRELWSDLLDPRALAQVLAQRPDAAWLYESEPAVLGAWGRAQRDLVAQLLALEERAGIQVEAPFRDEPSPFDEDAGAEPAPVGRLQALQASVLLRSDRPWNWRGEGDEPSLQLHATHGLVRQAEVLHDCLLRCFEELEDLQPGDVAVFCADVDAAAGAIEAAFGGVSGSRRIPFELSGRRAAARPLVAAALELLSIAEGRARLPAVCAWLDNPAAAAALGLDAQQVGELIAWLDEAGVRWGLDDHEGPAKHHWQAAIDRLLLGAALGTEAERLGPFAPVAGAQAVAGLLERLLPLLDALAALCALGREPRPVAAWCDAAYEVFGALLGPVHRSSDALAGLFDALAGLAEGAAVEPQARLDAPGFRQALTDALDRGAAAAVASGSVTVCPLGGLRGVPFRVVCLLGMDEDAFPRRGTQGELDLMLRAPRFGDRVARIDDRGVFLDALLAARDRVLVFYQGRDARDGSERNPSTVVGELLDYVNVREAGRVAAFRAVPHPLHPFSPRAFAGHWASHATEWEATARAAATPMAQRAPAAGPLVRDPDAWPASPLVAEALDVVEVRNALARPAETWLRHALGLRLPRGAEAIEEDEPLWEDARRDRPMVEVTARRLLAGVPEHDVLAAVLASPQTAARGAGRAHAQAVLAAARSLADRARSGMPAGPRGALQVSLEVALPGEGAPMGLGATLEGLGQDGFQLRVSAFPMGADAMIEAWLAHACWTAWLAGRAEGGLDDQRVADACTRLATPDGAVTLRGAQAARLLPHALGWVLRIRTQPLPLFPRSFYSWFANDQDIERARRAMFGDEAGRTTPEVARPWVAALHRDAPPSVEAAIEASAEVYGPLFECCELEKRARSEEDED